MAIVLGQYRRSAILAEATGEQAKQGHCFLGGCQDAGET